MSPGTGDAALPGTATLLTRMLQFGDSVLPIGGFAFSGGLESAIQKRTVFDTASLLEFARTAVEQASRGDAIAVICAHRAALAGDIEELVRIDKLLLSVTGSADMQNWRERVVSGATPGCYPVALAVNFAAQALSARDAFVVHQYGVAATILSAALRLMRVSHIDTQRMLFELSAGSDAAYEIAARSDLEAMAGFAPMTEILASVHVKAHVRLFMN
jgi:urease accessory protein